MANRSFLVETRQFMPVLYRFVYAEPEDQFHSVKSLRAGGPAEVEVFQYPDQAEDPVVELARRRDVIEASTPRAAVLDVLQRLMEPRRVRLRELGAPQSILKALGIRAVASALDQISPEHWQYRACTDEMLEFTSSPASAETPARKATADGC
jgi:hypothetical protein